MVTIARMAYSCGCVAIRITLASRRIVDPVSIYSAVFWQVYYKSRCYARFNAPFSGVRFVSHQEILAQSWIWNQLICWLYLKLFLTLYVSFYLHLWLHFDFNAFFRLWERLLDCNISNARSWKGNSYKMDPHFFQELLVICSKDAGTPSTNDYATTESPVRKKFVKTRMQYTFACCVN